MKTVGIWSALVCFLSIFLLVGCGRKHTCTDGEQNGFETGIDCGGPCISCDSVGLIFPIDTSNNDTMTLNVSCDTLICAKVNGNDFVGVETSAEDIGGTLSLRGENGDEIINIFFDGPYEVGAYSLDTTETSYQNGFFFYTEISNSTFTVTAIDATAETISGTFEFTATFIAGGTSVQITEGAFNNLYYGN